jgi:hypothetical protein
LAASNTSRESDRKAKSRKVTGVPQNNSSPFRPTRQPAQAIYDAFVAEASQRKHRTVDQWIIAERLAVWTAARDYAQQRGLAAPELDAVQKVERMAMGHIDYAKKWAYGVADLIADFNAKP